MKISWNEMSGREKLMVIGGSAMLLILIGYLLFIKPVCDEYVRLQAEVPDRVADLAWMRSVAGESRNLTAAAGKVVGPASLLRSIDESARQHNVSANLVRVEPVGDNGVKLWLENVLYTDFFAWFRFLVAGNGFSVSSLAVEKSGASGVVNVRLSLEQR
ncbi:MAG: type II secretion system protein M [Proteobacteria bacterium]|nr:type II secretion system protein M [Pseudomonadota bacterium]